MPTCANWGGVRARAGMAIKSSAGQSRVLWASKGEIDSNGGRHDGVLLLYLLCVWTVAARGTWLYLNRGKVT